jgi:hypothetical protein
MGVAVLPRILATGLSEVFQEIELPAMEVYLVTRPQALKQGHIQGFFGVLEGVLREAVRGDGEEWVARWCLRACSKKPQI